MTGLSPTHDAVQHPHHEQGEGQVPGVAHGDEHHVAVVAQVPLWPVRRVEHETNLRVRGGRGERR